MVHALKEGDQIGIRGPLETLSFKPNKYDRIVMVSLVLLLVPVLPNPPLPKCSTVKWEMVLNVIRSQLERV